MGLLQQAMKTYDSMSRIVGVTGGDGKEPLAPVGHITTKPQIRITIDADGTFLQAEAIDELKVIIPVTEQSAGRTSGICPHPICDQVGYITDSNQKKHSEYLQQLEGWACSDYSHPKVKAVFSYLGRNTVTTDLEKAGLERLLCCFRQERIRLFMTGMKRQTKVPFTKSCGKPCRLRRSPAPLRHPGQKRGCFAWIRCRSSWESFRRMKSGAWIWLS